MKLRLVIAVVVALGLAAAAAWFQRGSPTLSGIVPTQGSTPETGATLKAAGVHKCVGGGRTSYVDGAACPAGTHEVAASGGTMTVTSFPKPKPAPGAGASSPFGGPIVKPMDPEERDRLRDKAIEDAMNRR